MKAFLKRLAVGVLCGLGALALCLILLSFTIGDGTLYVSFPAVVRFFGTDNAKAVYLAAVLLFLCYGGVGAICRTIFYRSVSPFLRSASVRFFRLPRRSC